MRWRYRATIPGFLYLLVRVATAGAQATTPSVVWYRASEECPSGAEFLGRLARGSSARLAEAGDHIDFVVTLVAARGATLGRLERQTQSGTVAIRELRDVSCEHVADALALSLGLALEPAQPTVLPLASNPPPASTTPTDGAAPTPSGAAPSTPIASPVPPRVTPAPVSRAQSVAPVAPPVSARAIPAHASPRWSTGLAGGALFGVAPSALPRAAAFVDLDHAFPRLASELAFRLAVVGALGSSATEVGPVRHWIAAGRAEVCPWRWGGARAALRPCVAFELGVAGASDTRASGQRASSVWAAPGLGLRGGLGVLPKLTLELEAGALLPLLRSEVDAGSVRLYRTEVIAFFGQLGVSVGPF